MISDSPPTSSAHGSVLERKKEGESMTIGRAPICVGCKHLNPAQEWGNGKCAAFPDGIPDEIWVKGFDHTKPYPGDHGIRFEAKAEAAIPASR
jgi:hypothetical protein